MKDYVNVSLDMVVQPYEDVLKHIIWRDSITIAYSLSDEIHNINFCKRGQRGTHVRGPLGRGMKE